MHYQDQHCGCVIILFRNVSYKSLSALGITLWQPRPFRHAVYNSQSTLIVPEQLRINARCAVLLFIPDLINSMITAAEQKILTGMLSVLELNRQDLMLVRIYSKQPDLALVATTLQQWLPATILQMDSSVTEINILAPVVRTYSPEYLLLNPQHKPQAYKDLLTLRKILHHGTS